MVASSFFPGHQLPAAMMLSFPGFTKSSEVRYTGGDCNKRVPALKKAPTLVNFNQRITSALTCDLMSRVSRIHDVECRKCSHPAKIPFRPLLEKLAERPFL